MLWISFICTNKPSVAPCCLHICDSCTRIAQEKSGERYPNSVVSFGLNRAYIKIRTPNSPCTDNTWFFEYFYGFLGFVVWEISGHFWGVYQSHYCASAVAFLFSFVYVLYLNIASYLYGKQIESKFGLSCIYEWFSFVYAWIGYISMSAVPCPLKWRIHRGRRLFSPSLICMRFPLGICDECGIQAGSAYPSEYLVPSLLGLAYAPIVDTSFPELAVYFFDFSPCICAFPRLLIWNRWTIFDRKQEINVVYYDCVFGQVPKCAYGPFC